MVAKVTRWGNSLGLRIPKGIAEDARIAEGSEVEVAVEQGRIVLTPVAAPRYNLQALLAEVTASNQHQEIDFGPPRGKELW
jgi:antitoxin MazE